MLLNIIEYLIYKLFENKYLKYSFEYSNRVAKNSTSYTGDVTMLIDPFTDAYIKFTKSEFYKKILKCKLFNVSKFDVQKMLLKRYKSALKSHKNPIFEPILSYVNLDYVSRARGAMDIALCLENSLKSISKEILDENKINKTSIFSKIVDCYSILYKKQKIGAQEVDKCVSVIQSSGTAMSNKEVIDFVRKQEEIIEKYIDSNTKYATRMYNYDFVVFVEEEIENFFNWSNKTK